MKRCVVLRAPWPIPATPHARDAAKVPQELRTPLTRLCRHALGALLLLGFSLGGGATDLERIHVNASGEGFATEHSQKPFKIWGVNYDHDAAGALLEDYWETDWERVAEDFREMRDLGVNVVRIHLQTHRFLLSPDRPHPANLRRLDALLELAEAHQLYLDITGLGQYHRETIPSWFMALDETQRWRAQAQFWEAVASVGAGHPSVFCYNLMNEPILPGKSRETDWLAGEFGGKTFVQRLALESRGRERGAIAESWVRTMTEAIRRHDPDALVTLGVIPWGLVFPGAQPVFYAPDVAHHLDFVSLHVYPKPDNLDLVAPLLESFSIGKPVVIEETFPLHCDPPTFHSFLTDTWPLVDGVLGFYWGEPAAYYDTQPDSAAKTLTLEWLRLLRAGAPKP